MFSTHYMIHFVSPVRWVTKTLHLSAPASAHKWWPHQSKSFPTADVHDLRVSVKQIEVLGKYWLRINGGERFGKWPSVLRMKGSVLAFTLHSTILGVL